MRDMCRRRRRRRRHFFDDFVCYSWGRRRHNHHHHIISSRRRMPNVVYVVVVRVFASYDMAHTHAVPRGSIIQHFTRIFRTIGTISHFFCITCKFLRTKIRCALPGLARFVVTAKHFEVPCLLAHIIKSVTLLIGENRRKCEIYWRIQCDLLLFLS